MTVFVPSSVQLVAMAAGLVNRSGQVSHGKAAARHLTDTVLLIPPPSRSSPCPGHVEELGRWMATRVRLCRPVPAE